MTSWYDDKLTWWQADMLTSWHADMITCWQADKNSELHDFGLLSLKLWITYDSLTRVKSRDASASKNGSDKKMNWVFELLKSSNEEGFKEALGNKSVLGLRDSNYNNIYHLASHASWNEQIAQIVLSREGARQVPRLTSCGSGSGNLSRLTLNPKAVKDD